MGGPNSSYRLKRSEIFTYYREGRQFCRCAKFQDHSHSQLREFMPETLGTEKNSEIGEKFPKNSGRAHHEHFRNLSSPGRPAYFDTETAPPKPLGGR